MKAGELSLGSTIVLNEADGAIGRYTLVEFDYNDGIALLWRDSSVGTVAWQEDDSSDTQTYHESDLDLFQINWYNGLPQATQSQLSQVQYPVASANDSSASQTYALRWAATVSAFEVGGTYSGNELYGSRQSNRPTKMSFDYWTRQPAIYPFTSSYQWAYGYSSEDDAFAQYITTTSMGVRPTVGVSQENILATYDSTLGAYVLSPIITAPQRLYLGGSEENRVDFQPGRILRLNWDEPIAGTVEYYQVYTSCSDGTGYWSEQLTTPETYVWSPDKGYQTNTFFLYTKFVEDDVMHTTPDVRSISTKNSNVWVYISSASDPTQYRWHLASVNCYNASGWINTGGMNYYGEDNAWHEAGQ